MNTRIRRQWRASRDQGVATTQTSAPARRAEPRGQVVRREPKPSHRRATRSERAASGV